jgi:hypothetical protein
MDHNENTYCNSNTEKTWYKLYLNGEYYGTFLERSVAVDKAFGIPHNIVPISSSEIKEWK